MFSYLVVQLFKRRVQSTGVGAVEGTTSIGRQAKDTRLRLLPALQAPSKLGAGLLLLYYCTRLFVYAARTAAGAAVLRNTGRPSLWSVRRKSYLLGDKRLEISEGSSLLVTYLKKKNAHPAPLSSTQSKRDQVSLNHVASTRSHL